MIWQVIPIDTTTDTSDLATDTNWYQWFGNWYQSDTNWYQHWYQWFGNWYQSDTNDGVHQKVWGKLNHTIRLSILKHAVKLLNISQNCTKNNLPYTFWCSPEWNRSDTPIEVIHLFWQVILQVILSDTPILASDTQEIHQEIHLF